MLISRVRGAHLWPWVGVRARATRSVCPEHERRCVRSGRYEAGAHMAEETRDARTAAPRGIIATVLCCGGFGLVYILGMLFATPDITALEVPVQVPHPLPCVTGES